MVSEETGQLITQEGEMSGLGDRDETAALRLTERRLPLGSNRYLHV